MMTSTILFALLSLPSLVQGEVVADFKRVCNNYFYNGVVPVLAPSSNYKHICQVYENRYHFATLYDTQNRIPVYSAYTIQEGSCRPNIQWMVEPQLVDQNWEKDMMTEHYLASKYKVQLTKIGERQALDQDYNTMDVQKWHRGHLNPVLHNNEHYGGCKATFTLTNVVPQNSKLNQGQWRAYENELKKLLTNGDCSTVYVLVGAIPSQGNNKHLVNNRVNIPSLLWNAYCCLHKNKTVSGRGAIAQNTENKVVKDLPLDDLIKIIIKFNPQVGQNVELFSNGCRGKHQADLDAESIFNSARLEQHVFTPALLVCLAVSVYNYIQTQLDWLA